LEPWAKQKGFTDVLVSSLEINSSGIATGKLRGLNCWGPEKARRIKEHLHPIDQYYIYAYGDSLGDKELLALADETFFRHIPKN
jgi:phosphoserine phosphatase